MKDISQLNIELRLAKLMFNIYNFMGLIAVSRNPGRNRANITVLMHGGGTFDFYILFKYTCLALKYVKPLGLDSINGTFKIEGILRDKGNAIICFKLIAARRIKIFDKSITLTFKDSLRMFTGDLAYLCSLAGIKESKLIKYAQMQAIWNDLSIIAYDNNNGKLNKNSGRGKVNTLYPKLIEQGLPTSIGPFEITAEMTEYEAFKVYSLIDTYSLYVAMIALIYKFMKQYNINILTTYSTPSSA